MRTKALLMRHLINLESDIKLKVELKRIRSGDKNVVFIIGAGASKPYGYPTGKELIEKIKLKLSDLKIREMLEEHFDKALLEKFSRKIHADFPLNIDKFIRNNYDSDFARLGSFLIAYCLVEIQPSVKDSDWYAYVADMLVEKCESEKDVLAKNYKFITFNYDAVIEWQLLKKLRACEKFQFGEGLIDYVNKNVFHMYGSLNNISVEDALIQAYEGKRLVDFSLMSQNELNTIYGNKSVGEEARKQITSWILEADILYIIGFGFDQDNVSLLNLKHLADKEQYMPFWLYCFDYKGRMRDNFKSLHSIWNAKKLKNAKFTYKKGNSIAEAFETGFVPYV